MGVLLSGAVTVRRNDWLIACAIAWPVACLLLLTLGLAVFG